MPSLLPGESDSNPGSTLVDISEIITFLLPPLHANAIADLTFWSECELIQWIDAGVKRLARAAGLFIGRSVDVTTTIGQGTYALPSQHVSTIHASYDGAPLRPSSTGELEARNPDYQTAQAPPERWYQDTLGLARIGLAPVPDQQLVLDVLYHGFPQAVDCAKTHTTIPLPDALEPAIELYVIREAYSKEGDAHAPDIAAAAGDLAGLYERVAAEYWGGVQ